MYRIFFLLFFLPFAVYCQSNLPPRGEVFRNDVVPQVFIEIAEEDLEEIFADGNEYSDEEHPATFIFDNGTVRDTVENIGFRLRGNTSRIADKKSYKISFNTFENQTFYGLEKMNLNGEHNDPSAARARVCWDLLRDMKLPGARVNHAELYINGDYYGLYANVEHIDEIFVKTYFGNDEGNLYKCLYPADLNYMGENPNFYKQVVFGRRKYDLKTNTERDDYTDLAELIDVINNTPIEGLECAVERVLNVESFLQYLAFDILTGNWDGPHFNKNNFYLYQNPATGKFEYIPYDLDNTLGIDFLYRNWATRDMYDWGRSDDTDRPLYFRMLEVPAFRERFNFYTTEILDNFFNAEAMFPYLDSMRAQLLPSIPDDPFYPLEYGFSVEDFEESFETELPYFQTDFGIKQFIEIRAQSSYEQVETGNTAPIISYLKHNFPLPGEPLIFTAKVTDETAVAAVHICYTEDGASSETCLAMSDDGENGDGAADDDIYGVILENTSSIGLIYYVEAIDTELLINRVSTCANRLVQAAADLVINEIMVKNVSIIADETGAYEDWIEIYNRGNASIYLGDFYLTDNHEIPGKWQLPKTDLPPDSYLLIWADNDPEDGTENHANFKLASTEEIGLFRKTNDAFTAVDLLRYENLAEDESYARVPNGTGAFATHFSTPGWNNNNLSSLANESDETDFSIQPNPHSGIFAIVPANRAEVYGMEIYDLRGILLQRKERASGTVTMRLNEQNGGIFIVKIIKENGDVRTFKTVAK